MCSIIEKCLAYVRTKDSIGQPSVMKFHFNDDIKIKTLSGGLLSLCFTALVARFFYVNTQNMVTYDDPTIE